MKLSMLIGSTVATPVANPGFNATQQLEDAHINYKHFLIGTRNNRVPDYVGPRLAEKWNEIGQLYQVIHKLDVNPKFML